jgi:hypothetical protein
MKYVLLFVDTPEFEAELDAMSDEERGRALRKVHEWLGTHADKIRGGNKLRAPETATTVGSTAANRSSPTGRSWRARRSSAATPRSRSRTSTKHCGW